MSTFQRVFSSRTWGLVLLLAVACTGWADRRNQPRGKPGEFDFYVLSLSWSPNYCSTPPGQRDKLQCTGPRQYDFVLHGLWPQYERGYPQFCGTGPNLPASVLEKMLDIMPSRTLVRHEWERHGVCSGLNPEAYFDLARRAYSSIAIPSELRSPKDARTVPPEKIRQEFTGNNAGMKGEAMTVQCNGRFLSEVRVCLNKDLKTRACPAEVQRQQCRAAEIIVRPIR